jgi:redox-sensitive bicupin YhaK (pirin superfamily)
MSDRCPIDNDLSTPARLVPSPERAYLRLREENTMADRNHGIRKSRELERAIAGHAASDGAGVRLTRVLTQDLQGRLDPFLMLDAFRSDDPDDYIAGFPNHPHRGFETVTYMLAGRMRHRDDAGNEGLLSAGGVQWMTAGRGIVHSEMPEQQNGLMHGFQLWLNLPARDKMTAPGYRDIPAAEIPSFDAGDGARVKVIAGESHGVKGAIAKPVTEPLFLDVDLPAGSSFAQALPAAHNAFLYVYAGEVRIADGKPLAEGRMGFSRTTSTPTESASRRSGLRGCCCSPALRLASRSCNTGRS